MPEKLGYVYVLSSGFKHLYIGVTSSLERRVWQHQNGTFAAAFTERYNIKHLVYFERWGSMSSAIAREKQLKRWSRIKKIRLIVAANPTWCDLSLEWGEPIAFSGEGLGVAGQNTGVSPLRSCAPPVEMTEHGEGENFATKPRA
jgi:putative endonuclease